MNDVCAIFWAIKGNIKNDVIKNDTNEPDKVGQQNTDGMRHFYGAHVSFLLISSPVCTSQSTL